MKMGKFYLIVLVACVATAAPLDDPPKTTAAVEALQSPTTKLDATSIQSDAESTPNINVPAQEAKETATESKPTVNVPKEEESTVKVDVAETKPTVNVPKEEGSSNNPEGPASAESGEDDSDDLNTDASRWYRKRKHFPVYGYYRPVPRFYGPKAYFIFG